MLRRLMMASSYSPSPIVLIGSTGVTGGTGGSILPAIPSGAMAGDLLIMCVSIRGDRNATATSSWTEIADIRSGTGTGASRVKVFTCNYTGSSPTSITHSASAAYGACITAVRGGVVVGANGNQSTIDASAPITAPNGSLLIGFGSINPRSTTGSEVPVGAQEGWTSNATSVYITSSTNLNYLLYAYSTYSTTSTTSIRVGTDYGSDANRVGTVWGCAIY